MRNLTNQKFGKLLAIKPISKNRSKQIVWLCICDCGNEKQMSCDHLTRQKNPVKSCGCCRFRSGKFHHQFNGHEGITGGWWNSHVTRERTQTSRPKIDVTVTIEEAWKLIVKQEFRCALSGVIISIANNSTTNTASIDRIDSSKGYHLNNIQWVHKHVNFMKRTYTQEYFIAMCKLIAETNK